ncbi:MAG: RNA pseudouridine synthase [Firmicutes bacterium]|nr:RNA pseudouridine synthase [Bacillota bacterium]
MTPRIPLLYEDNHLLVVEKPANMLSQGDSTGDADLLTILKQKLKAKYQKPGNVYLGLVHRLDRPTGGVMVFAKTSKAASRLAAQIQNGTFTRAYLAVVHGKISPAKGTLKHYLQKNKKTNFVAVVEGPGKGAKEAILSYRVLDTTANLTLVQVQLHTGRAHQVRVQFAACGHPLFGDQRYGSAVNQPGQQLALWAHAITFNHPTRKESMTFTSFPAPIQPWLQFASFFAALKESQNLVKWDG